MRIARVLLVIVAVVCLGVAISYPIRYNQAKEKNDTDMEDLARMRQQARQSRVEGTRDDAIFPALPAAFADDTDEEQALSDAEPAQEEDLSEDSIEAAPGSGGDAVDSSAGYPAEDAGISDPASVPEGPSGEPIGSIAQSSESSLREPVGSEAQSPEILSGEPGGSEARPPEGPPKESVGSEAQSSEGPSGEPGVNGAQSLEDLSGDPGGSISQSSEGLPEESGGAVRPAKAVDDHEAGRSGGSARADDGEGVNTAESSAGGFEGTSMPEEPAVPTPEPTPTPKPTPTPEPTREPNYWDLGKYYAPTSSPTPTPKLMNAGPTIQPTPTPDRSIRSGPLPYALKEKVELDEAAILPELRDIYTLNKDLVGWINIPDTVIDYPVVRAEDGEFYLSHDFYGEENVNGQILLDMLCDPYTPSYNLVVSGHHMKNGSMFGGLPEYRNRSYWAKHPFLEFDTLMERKIYVIFACFYSADYDEDETGFRYNAIIDYKIDADRWLAEIEENQLYDTGIERAFGDEFITLTTCDRARHRNGRFVVVGRRIREGEIFE